MAFQLKDGQGSLFWNDRKEKPEQPDFQGQLQVGGVAYRIAGWLRESQKGNKWLSLSVKPDERASAAPPAAAAPATGAPQANPF
jgi:hypothetical protein